MRRLVLIAAGLLVAAGGCAKDQRSAASAHQNPRDPFETMKDPPITPKTHFAAGQLAEEQGRFQQAIEQYEKALAQQPKYLDAMYRLGVCFAQIKDYPRAISTWERYIATSGGSATAYSNLAFCQELAGNPAAAEVAYKQGIARDPKNEPCRVNYGLMLARHDRYNEGLLQLQIVLTPAQAHYDLASVYETQGRRQEARTEYRKAIELDPELLEAKSRLAALPD